MSERKDVAMPLPSDVKEILPIWETLWETARNATDKSLGDIEVLWPDLIKNPPRDTRWFYWVFRWMAHRGKVSAEAQQDLVVLLLQELQSQGDFSFMYDMVKFSVGTWPTCPKFGALTGAAMRGLYGSESWFRDLAGMLQGVDLASAIKRFESLYRLTPGQVWRHHEMGDGLVTEFIVEKTEDPSTKKGKRVIKAQLDFPSANVKGKVYTFEGITQFLKHYPSNHVVALRLAKPEVLQEKAQSDIQGLLRMMLRSHGGRMTQSEIKEFLHGTVVDEKKWSSWWEKARTTAGLDPHIDFDGRGGAHAVMIWRDTARTLSDEISQSFFSSNATVASRVETVSELCTRMKKGDHVDQALLDRMAAALVEVVSNEDFPLLDRVQAAMMCKDLGELGAQSVLPENLCAKSLLTKVQEDYVCLSEIENVDYSVRILEHFFERDGDEGRDRACRLLPKAGPTLAKAIWKELDREAHVANAVEAVQELLASPLDNPETYVWAVRGILTGDWDHLTDYIPVSRLVPELVDQLSEWVVVAEQKKHDKAACEAAKNLVGRVRQLLQARGKIGDVELDFAPIRLAVMDLPEEQILALRSAVSACLAFAVGPFRAGAERAIMQSMEKLAKEQAAAGLTTDFGEYDDEEEVVELRPEAKQADTPWHWCTKEGREKTFARLSYLQNDAIPKNAVEIETARAEGDLKENAGYHAARERHGMLMDEANMLSVALSNARVFDFAALTTDKIGFGVKFKAENLNSGAVEEFTVLGPFESDVEKGIINYKTHMMKHFLGATVGEEVRVVEQGSGPSGRSGGVVYKIVEIQPAQ